MSLARAYAWLIVALRLPIVLAWIAALVAALVLLPWLGGASTAPLDDIVPAGAPALRTQERALALFGSTIATDSVVVDRNPRGLGRAGIAAQLRAATRPRPAGLRAAVPLLNVPLPGVRWGERGTTAITYLFLAPDLNLVERDRVAHRYAAGLGRPAPGETRGVTGAGPARLEQFREIDRVLPWIEGATVVVIFAIVALYFRSLGAPLVTLATAALAYAIAVRVLAWSGERAGVTAPSEIEPVLVVLLLGLVTDYTVFFMSETRRRLALGEPRVVAARGATARIAPLVLVAGVLVAGGAVSLLAGRMQFFRVFGPGLAIAALVVTVVSVTLVPALMGLLGPRLFGGGRAEDGAELPRVLARLRTARPAAALIALLCAGALALAATGARPTHLGVSFVPSLPRGSEPWQAADAAAHGFVPGVVAPTELLLEQPGIGARTAALARAQRLLAREPGVAAVVGPAQASGSALERFAVARGGGAARVALVLRDEPTGAAAIAALRRLERRLPALFRAAGLPNGVRASLGGETALAQETVDALVGDLERVGAATAVVMLVLLALFLRALVAPLLLLGGSVLSFAGSFGLTATLIGGDFVYYVPLVGAVMLIGLGSDYNVLIAGRIREEAGRRRLREAIAVAGPAASRAITVAGITLASTFALLAIVPLEPFRQLAALMTLGVLIDALVVRPLLIPALIALAGRRAWWPRPPGVPWTPPPGSPRECTPPAESRRG